MFVLLQSNISVLLVYRNNETIELVDIVNT